jgi:hypothetical protein
MCYAITNNVFEQKLTKYSLGILLTYFSTGTLIGSLFLLLWEKNTGVLITPPKTEALLICGMAILFFLADYFYVSAYKTGGDVFTIASIFVIFPAFAALIKFFWTGSLPNSYQIGGYLTAIVSVFLFVKGFR